MVHKSCVRCAYKVTEQEWDRYSVARALKILKGTPRAATVLPLKDIDLVSIRGSVKSTVQHVTHVDARRPVIVIKGRKRYVVIDGNHRAAKQLRRGAAVRAYILTAEEARQIRDK
jgi:hypothetical protein